MILAALVMGLVFRRVAGRGRGGAVRAQFGRTEQLAKLERRSSLPIVR